MNAEIENRIEEIREDASHGAGWLARRAVSVLCLAAVKGGQGTTDDFLQDLRVVAANLAEARPAMIPIANGVFELLHLILLHARKERDVEQLKRYAQGTAWKLVKTLIRASHLSAEGGSSLISENDLVISCSYSDTVIRSLEMAHRRGAQFSAVIARSETAEGNAYGEGMARRLLPADIMATVIPDEEIETWALHATKAVVGADSILPDGSVINGQPSLRLAMASASARIPFYIVAETAKFNRLLPNAKIADLEEGFDLIPPRLISGVITEEGLLRPNTVIWTKLFRPSKLASDALAETFKR